jgi:hypothetical protein
VAANEVLKGAMIRKRIATASAACAILCAAMLADCGGGGSALPGPGSGHPNPSPSPSPVPSSTPALIGGLDVATSGTNPKNAHYGPVGNGNVIFSCGCNVQAGFGTTDASGNMVLVANSTPTPSAPNPIYTIAPGRNYLEVGTTAAGAEAWTFQFAGKSPATNLSLEASNRSDAYTAAASLFVYFNSPTGNAAYDHWNFNTIATWLTTLKNSPNAAETTLLDDIVTETVANHTLFPAAPTWNAGQPTSALISKDIKAVNSSVDSSKPTPCPAGCTGTPTP